MAKRPTKLDVSVAEVVDYMRITDDFAPALAAVLERKVTVAAAKQAGLRVTAAERQAAADDYRAARGLQRARDTDRWLRSIGITLATFEQYVTANLLIAKFKKSLYEKAEKQVMMSSQELEEAATEMAYREWLKKALKA